ncbi:probable leucine-rich repeat receptor-like protein kinase At2g28990 [Nymphaea colorata]|nr:probable leucine-rich repeat receptor-like protein kinase At2g28990 [Nymphaea colorata]
MAYSMEVLEAPEKVRNGTALEKPASEAKESGRHAASRVSSTGTDDRTLLVDAVARHFTYNEIWSITGNFSQVTGEGGSSTVYFGQLPEDRANELTWRRRLRIALDAAIGLEYLHTGCKPAVIHRDIKPANILLDENLQAKLADLGLSKAGAIDGTECSAYQTKVAGTMGYIDPEYLYTQTLTEKNGVYSFGIVLFELITGKPPIMITETNEKCHLTKWVIPMIIRGEIESLLDPLLKGQCNIQSVWEVAAIAKAAIQNPAGRPDMTQIVSTLRTALRMETSSVDTSPVCAIITRQSSF